MKAQSKERGTILVISLIILLVMTTLVVSSLRSATMGEKMSSNTHDRQLAFQAAEAALRAGERYLDSNNSPVLEESCSSGICTNPRKQTVTGWIGDPSSSVWGNARTVDITLDGIKTTARYMIEDMCEFTPTSGVGGTDSQRMFRVTAYATGGTDSSRVMLQSSYAVSNEYGAFPFCNCDDISYCTICGNINCTP